MNTAIRKSFGLVLLIVGTFFFVNSAPMLYTSIALAPQIAAASSILRLKYNPLLLAVGAVVISLTMMFLGGILPKKGRGQRAEGRREERFLICPMPLGLKPLNLFMKKIKEFSPRRVALWN